MQSNIYEGRKKCTYSKTGFWGKQFLVTVISENIMYSTMFEHVHEDALRKATVNKQKTYV